MYKYRLTEEIARWAFEILCRGSSEWYIAFTNPTAGPWKSVKAPAADGTVGEIYRFGSSEERPDIVLVNDRLRIIIIVEAKDLLGNLTAGRQTSKSVQVVSDMSRVLHGLKGSPFWQYRWQYRIIVGLLWGSECRENRSQVTKTFRIYEEEMSRHEGLDDTAIIGIETHRSWNDSLTCSILYHLDDDSTLTEYQVNIIAGSLGLTASPC